MCCVCECMCLGLANAVIYDTDTDYCQITAHHPRIPPAHCSRMTDDIRISATLLPLYARAPPTVISVTLNREFSVELYERGK